MPRRSGLRRVTRLARSGRGVAGNTTWITPRTRAAKTGTPKPVKAAHAAHPKPSGTPKSRVGVPHPHKGSHAPRKHHPQSAAARARRVGKKHPHKGFHGHRKPHHISAAARARMVGRKHPHRGHAVSSATRKKISTALRGRHRATKRRR